MAPAQLSLPQRRAKGAVISRTLGPRNPAVPARVPSAATSALLS